MNVSDFLLLLITCLLSIYPVSKLVKYRDRRKYFNWIELNTNPEGNKSREEVKQRLNNIAINNLILQTSNNCRL